MNKLSFNEAWALWSFMAVQNSKCHSALALKGVPLAADRRVEGHTRLISDLLREMADAIGEPEF